MSHGMSRKKCIQLFLVLAVSCAIFFRAQYIEDMHQQVMMSKEMQSSPMSVKNPRVNYMNHPVGIDESGIFFSWEPEGVQKAYEMMVMRDGETVWDSGIVCSDQTIQIRYRGPELADAEKYEYQIFVLHS